MGIKSDRWIRHMAENHQMIQPFEAQQVKKYQQQPLVSYGTSSYGYDVRCANQFKIFTNINASIVDPKNFDENNFVDIEADICIIPPNSFALARTVEYFKIPRDVLTLCLGKSTYARCFCADTRVALVDGSSPTLEDMARRAEEGELFWGYSTGENGRLMVTLLDAPRYIGRDNLLEITLDNNKKIRCTPDHSFMLRDGRWLAAAELRAEMSLMPLYRQWQRGYEMVYQPLNGHLYPTHRLADEWNLRFGVYADTANTHRHHLDINRQNNNPWNITRINASEHKQRQNPSAQTRQAHREAMLRRYQNAAERLRHANAMSNVANLSSERRTQQAEMTRHINLRADIDAETVKTALHRTGSIRGAARHLNCDRSVFQRFPEIISMFRGQASNHKVVAVKSLAGEHDVYCLTVPEAGNFALESGVFVHNCGIIVNVTPLEPCWQGHVTLEFSNTTPLPAKIYANEGVAQLIFISASELCETSYAERNGKYQGQTGVTLPKI
jgi:dCTP deaminase